MSHDITAISQATGEKISFITIGPLSQGKSWILYESLDCNDFNYGLCGSGNSKLIHECQIKISLSKFRYLCGESDDDVIDIVSSSPQCKSSVSVLKSILMSIGKRFYREDVKLKCDEESLLDVERFLLSIQNNGDIFIKFE